MAFEQSMASEVLGRILYKNGVGGEPLSIADGDDNVFFFPGSETMSSEYQATFRTVAAIASACFNRPETRRVSGATGVIRGCPINGAQEFLGQFVNGLAIGYDALGAVASLDIESPGDSNCLDCDTAASASSTWSMVEIICYRDCNNNVVDIRANIARSITAADPSGAYTFGGTDPTANAIDFNLTFSNNAGWHGGSAGSPGLLFDLYEDTGGAVDNGRPVSMGVAFADTDEYDEIIAACACDLSYAGIPLTAAMVTAATVPDKQLFTGAATP